MLKVLKFCGPQPAAWLRELDVAPPRHQRHLAVWPTSNSQYNIVDRKIVIFLPVFLTPSIHIFSDAAGAQNNEVVQWNESGTFPEKESDICSHTLYLP